MTPTRMEIYVADEHQQPTQDQHRQQPANLPTEQPAPRDALTDEQPKRANRATSAATTGTGTSGATRNAATSSTAGARGTTTPGRTSKAAAAAAKPTTESGATTTMDDAQSPTDRAQERQSNEQQAQARDQQPGSMTPSDEASAAQLELGKAQGDAYGKALDAMVKQSGGQTQRVGDYDIAVMAEEAEGMYHLGAGDLRWAEPGNQNVHFEVVVRDPRDGRFIPGLHVRITVDKVDGGHVGHGELPYVWHPWLAHYGQNWWAPGDGQYRVRVHIDPPTFMRHDKQNGRCFAEPVEAEFTLQVKTGQKQ